MALTAERRREVLATYHRATRELEEVEQAPDLDVERMTRLVTEKTDAIFEYQDGFPPIPVSRCPLTGTVARLSIDTFDLDGLWWNWGAALRGEHDLPPTTFAYTGAMRIGAPIADAPFIARTGPEVPYVVPRMLEHPAMRAVVSTLPVGPHTGYPILYFADPVPIDLRRVNHWGSSGYFARTSDGFGEFSVPEGVQEYDFDVAPWIESGKLQWIGPGDEALELRSTVDDCPYLDLPGHREISLIMDGAVHWSDDRAG